MRATNASGMKSKNKKLILDLIRKSNMSRAELANETGLTRAALTIIVDELLANGIVEERLDYTNRVGRNPSKLYLKGDHSYFAGVDVNRTGFTFGIIDLAGNLITNLNHPRCTPEEFMVDLPKMFFEALEEHEISPQQIHSFGVTTPGPVDIEKRVILNPPSFNDWHDLP
ncbi:winged helix-turn-helix transcriptional regulator, partial [Ruminococcaceae bacterium OttesenSCG-928-I18]|nr:winged helix-turn-helix transcriptional regulator [Ruminococcaceae bacterium OttesenSCG-928-I18]